MKLDSKTPLNSSPRRTYIYNHSFVDDSDIHLWSLSCDHYL